jgi:hypothetical protein
MAEIDDNQLLTEYVETGSEEAFAALVKRHAGFVRSIAFNYHPSPAREPQDVLLLLPRPYRIPRPRDR